MLHKLLQRGRLCLSLFLLLYIDNKGHFVIVYAVNKSALHVFLHRAALAPQSKTMAFIIIYSTLFGSHGYV